MLTKRFDGGWYREPSTRSWEYVAPGEYEEGVVAPSAKSINDLEILKLIPVLEENGFLKPRLDERLRAEDLRITHRLLDIIEKGRTR